VNTFIEEYKWKFRDYDSFNFDNIEDGHRYLQWLSNKLNIHQLNDWYSVKPSTIEQFGGRGLMKKYGNWMKTLQIHFPNYQWNRYEIMI
jgi:hypothetical protein